MSTICFFLHFHQSHRTISLIRFLFSMLSSFAASHSILAVDKYVSIIISSGIGLGTQCFQIQMIYLKCAGKTTVKKRPGISWGIHLWNFHWRISKCLANPLNNNERRKHMIHLPSPSRFPSSRFGSKCEIRNCGIFHLLQAKQGSDYPTKECVLQLLQLQLLGPPRSTTIKVPRHVVRMC